MERMNWWAILAVAALLGGTGAAWAGAEVSVVLCILATSIVSAIFSARE